MSVVVGVGMSSKATRSEIADLLAGLLVRHGLTMGDVTTIATRRCFVGDERLALGPAVVGFADDELVAASAPPARSVGLPARVAETAAALASGHAPGTEAWIARSAHATAATVDGTTR